MSRPPLLHRLLVACYPRRWRERYADELVQVLADRGSGWRDLPNLLAAPSMPGSTVGSGPRPIRPAWLWPCPGLPRAVPDHRGRRAGSA